MLVSIGSLLGKFLVYSICHGSAFPQDASRQHDLDKAQGLYKARKYRESYETISAALPMDLIREAASCIPEIIDKSYIQKYIAPIVKNENAAYLSLAKASLLFSLTADPKILLVLTIADVFKCAS